ncbi:unnamed protein product [Arctia plantaginis]|uniref:Uncharacterized protein n=1 Tax=Arctia plantaginis TaxID=874455 RepID=A0A8S1AGM2_ARCPL|nr:unnamed protein product [Arctia plantaginis]
MKRSKSYTWLSGLLRPKPEEREEQDHEEWGAVPWVRADVMHHDRFVIFEVVFSHGPVLFDYVLSYFDSNVTNGSLLDLFV